MQINISKKLPVTMNPNGQQLTMLFFSWLHFANPLPLPDCPVPDSCGNLKIHYPFGTREGCYLDKRFLITCNETTGTPTLGTGNIRVLNISLDGQATVSSFLGRDCYNDVGVRTWHNNPWFDLAWYFPLSSSNKLIVIGCDTMAYVYSKSKRFSTGCLSICNTMEVVVNGSCSGIGCCQSSIPKDIKDFSINVTSYYQHNYTKEFNPCSYAFVVEDGVYNFSSADLAMPPDPSSPGLNTIKEFPMNINWAITTADNCSEAETNPTTYVCAENAHCKDSDEPTGYLCFCPDGYSGNPYIGCQDVDECQDQDLHQCYHTAKCENGQGNYTCTCPKGYHGDGRKSGDRCTANPSLTAAIAVGASIACSGFILIVCCAYWYVQRRKTNNHKQELFKENGGLMLRQLLSKIERTEEKAEIFTEDQLKKATNNFSKSEIVGQGGYGTVYKGTLDNKLVAIKKSKVVDRGQTEQFINEVIVLSQIKHPNAVKLIGCCLETPVPTLVYEFIANNTLHYHIHDEFYAQPMRWKNRLRIAAETAGALAHMHYDAPLHIIHRDVKSSNILLDHDLNAKVSDFGVSRLVPFDQTQLPTIVQGTIGYLDPEYFHTGIFTEKSDVYSFGVVLLELLTGQKVLCPSRPDKDKNLVIFFTSAMKNDSLPLILDQRVKHEGDPGQLNRVANLAMRCLRLEGASRPTMKVVEKELKELSGVDERLDASFCMDQSEESQPLFAAPTTNSLDYTGSSSYTTDSYKNQSLLQLSNMSLGR